MFSHRQYDRRKFFDPRTSDPERAYEAMARIRLFYAVEAEGKGLDEAGRLALRRERPAPLLKRLGTWLDEQARVVLPKSPIGNAIGYARSNWAALDRSTEAGSLSIDNNASGRAAAIQWTLAMTCKALKINPFAYLRDVLHQVFTHPARRVAELLPDCWRALRSGSGSTMAG